jgi:hypothetical protein
MGRKLLRDMPIGTRVVTIANPIGSYWDPVCVWEGDRQELPIYLYVVSNASKSKAAVASITLEEKMWRHPPPGSYAPRHNVPADTPRIPSNESHSYAREVCESNELFYHHTTLKRQINELAGPNSASAITRAVIIHESDGNISKGVEVEDIVTSSTPTPAPPAIQSSSTTPDCLKLPCSGLIPKAPPLPPSFS